MTSLKPQTPSVPKPKSGQPPKPKSGHPPKPPSPLSSFKPALRVGGLPGGIPNGFGGKQLTTVASSTATKVVPVSKLIEQQVAKAQRERMAATRRVESAINADKRADATNRRKLK
jgi:hypothetical protein